MESPQKVRNSIYQIGTKEYQEATYDDSQPKSPPPGKFYEKDIVVHPGQENFCYPKLRFFSNPLRTRKACVVFPPTQRNDFTNINRALNVFELYAKQGDEIFKLKNNILKNLKSLSGVEVVELKNLVNSKFNSAFRVKNLTVPDHAQLQAQTNAFFDSIILSIVKPESALLVRQSWASTSKSWGVYEIYAICQYILGDILEATKLKATQGMK
ncbi:MAG: hypothetical protein LBC11_02485 [Puniceicoccales bacterium]|jgi:hypothetical protein|nr:hypothetical protein [Puniceicoccales bacterium]